MFFVTVLLFQTFFLSCKSDQESLNGPEVVEIDISITSSESSIIYTDLDDLNEQIETAISIEYDKADETEVVQTKVFNTEMTEVSVSIDFKEEYKETYSDTNADNNTVSILIQEKAPVDTGVILKADGPGDTYELITSVLAPNRSPIEVPDCGHLAFGNHIDEIFDVELSAYVFRFFIHVSPDNDRCKEGVDDRQRNEIKTYDGSPENLQGKNGETVVYNWKFKLPIGFQSSSNFTHIHQIKSVGGDLSSMPIYTLTTRRGTPDQLELRYAETDRQVTLIKMDIAPLLGNWVEVTETVYYDKEGTYDIVINRIDDNTELLSYTSNSIVNWREGAELARPKWGVYRSLITSEYLRDEEVLFADFKITELK